MTDRIWNFVDDLLDASGGIIGVIMGFILPLVAMGLSIWVLTR